MKKNSNMIGLDKARLILARHGTRPETETVRLFDARNRVLAQDVVSKINMPPFDKSAMDGYAIASGDDSSCFRIMEVIPAGSIPRKKIKKGECSKIMTGAMLPSGADRVVIKEITRTENELMFITGQDSEFNVCQRGEDVKIGDKVLASGKLMTSADIGVIASMGLDTVKTFCRPMVGVLTTGAEIVEPGERIKKGQIFNSNAFSLAAQIGSMGLEVIYNGIVRDNPECINAEAERLMNQADVVLVSGGVSMGDFDFVPQVLEEIGVEIYFKKIAIKPGKPTVFGRRGTHFVFGLPGNPVSTFIIFEVLVKPFLYRMMGHTYSPPSIAGIMKQDFNRCKASRHELIPVVYSQGTVRVVEYHGSAHILSLSRANGLLEIPVGVKQIKKGTEVDVRPV